MKDELGAIIRDESYYLLPGILRRYPEINAQILLEEAVPLNSPTLIERIIQFYPSSLSETVLQEIIILGLHRCFQTLINSGVNPYRQFNLRKIVQESLDEALPSPLLQRLLTIFKDISLTNEVYLQAGRHRAPPSYLNFIKLRCLSHHYHCMILVLRGAAESGSLEYFRKLYLSGVLGIQAVPTDLANHAAAGGSLELFQYIERSFRGLEITDKTLEIAISMSSVEIALYLLETRPRLRVTRRSVLMIARHGQLELLIKLLNSGRGLADQELLYYSVASGNLEMIRYLLTIYPRLTIDTVSLESAANNQTDEVLTYLLRQYPGVPTIELARLIASKGWLDLLKELLIKYPSLEQIFDNQEELNTIITDLLIYCNVETILHLFKLSGYHPNFVRYPDQELREELLSAHRLSRAKPVVSSRRNR